MKSNHEDNILLHTRLQTIFDVYTFAICYSYKYINTEHNTGRALDRGHLPKNYKKTRWPISKTNAILAFKIAQAINIIVYWIDC